MSNGLRSFRSLFALLICWQQALRSFRKPAEVQSRVPSPTHKARRSLARRWSFTRKKPTRRERQLPMKWASTGSMP